MANLKDLRTRIGSVKSTKKITSAMKMVAASKLRQAQAQAEAARPYADKMNTLMARLVTAIGDRDEAIPLLDGTGANIKQLFIVISGERGLCGGFNGLLLKQTRHQINMARFDGKQIKIICIGHKAYDLLKRDFEDDIINHYRLEPGIKLAHQVTAQICEDYEAGDYDEIHVIYNHFKNAMTQEPTYSQLVPYKISESLLETFKRQEKVIEEQQGPGAAGWYLFKPNAQELLDQIISQQISTRLLQMILETAAGEQAARMTAMDNATRNASDMISELTIKYNRERQAVITREITEIVSGAEAL